MKQRVFTKKYEGKHTYNMPWAFQVIMIISISLNYIREIGISNRIEFRPSIKKS